MKEKICGRILFVIGSLTVGGAEQQLVLLAEQLVARGWLVCVFVLEKSGPLLDGLERAGVQILDGGYRSKVGTKVTKLFVLGRSEALLFRHIRSWRPDVVHAFLPLTNFMGAAAGRLAFAPLVITSKRGLGTHQDRHPWLKWLDRAANRMSDIVTANSSAIARDIEQRDGYDARRVKVIANGLDFNRFDNADVRRDELRRAVGLAPDERAIVFVANLIPYKGHAELIDALALLGGEHQTVKLFLIGDDRGIADDLIRRARRRGVLDRVILLGRRDDVPSLLAAMDVGVMASHEEGLSNALLEKLAAGLPVVATDVGGNGEALEGMPDCRLVRAHDAVDLARGLDDVLTVLDVARRGREMRRHLIRQHYSVAAMVDAYEQIYCQGKNLGPNAS